MDKNIDFTKLSNSEINLKIMSYTNEYEAKKVKIIELIKDLQVLDDLYRKANDELNKRGALSDG